MRKALQSGWLQHSFPGGSVEIFGAPGSGKSFFCEALWRRESICSTADNQVLKAWVDEDMWGLTRWIARLSGPRIMKNYYKLRIEGRAREFWREAGRAEQVYLATVDEAIQAAMVRPGTRRNVEKSVRLTGCALGRIDSSDGPLIVDEGMVRKLVTLLVQTKAPDASESLRPLLHDCLEQYPWAKNALYIEAPQELCVGRQNSRGHMVQGPGKSQAAQTAAAAEVFRLCRESGWRVRCIRNDETLHF